MKLLLVSIPNHHFFQWVSQLESSGYEVRWFDITDGGEAVNRIKWIKQYKGWKLKWNYPFRYTIKRKLPRFYNVIEKWNARKVNNVFEKILQNFQPDIVHCFEMRLSGLPILSTMENHLDIPFLYSSWGSDMFFFKEKGVESVVVKRFLNHIDYLITDCQRDYYIAKQNGFNSKYLGVFPGNGGIAIPSEAIQSVEKRNTIIIKGYDDGVGMASLILKAIELLPITDFQNIEIVIYSADNTIIKQVRQSKFLKGLTVTIHSRKNFFPNEELLKIMGKSILHIANSISDGMPNALLEAMGMGAFPIQSNPGKASEEVIVHGKNGFLIDNPLNAQEIARLIKEAISNESLRKSSQKYNVAFIQQQYNRVTLRPKIVQIYNDILA